MLLSVIEDKLPVNLEHRATLTMLHVRVFFL